MLTDLAARLALGEFILHTGRTSVRVKVVLALPLRGGKRHILAGDRTGAQPDSTLIAALRKAPRVTQSERGISVVQAAPPSAYDRMILRLAFLAPDLQRDSLAGRQPPELNLERLRNIDIPLAWSEERKVLGWRDTDAACSAE